MLHVVRISVCTVHLHIHNNNNESIYEAQILSIDYSKHMHAHTHTHTRARTHAHTRRHPHTASMLTAKLNLHKTGSKQRLEMRDEDSSTKRKTQNLPDNDLMKHYLDIHKSPSVEQCHHCSPMARAVRSEPELPSAGNASAPLRHQSYRQTSEG